MIKSESVGAIWSLADIINSKSKVLRPMSGTPLESLVLASSRCELFGEVIADTPEHNTIMDKLEGLSVQGVEAALHFSKNVVNPVIKQMVEAYENNTKDAIADIVSGLVVKPVFYPEFWDSAVLAGMVERFEETPVENIKLTAKFPQKTAEELAEFIKIGNASFDKEVETYLQQGGSTNMLVDIYTRVFSNETSDGAVMLNDVIGIDGFNRDASVVVHLLANKLLNDIPDGVSIPLSDYRLYITNILAQSGRCINRAMEKRINDEKNKTLIVSWPPYNYSGNSRAEIEVNGKVYNKWLEDGGSPEILFGAFMTDKSRDYGVLLEGKDNYISAWERQKRLLETKARIEMKNVKSKALRDAFFDTIKTLSDDVRTGTDGEIYNRAEVYLNDLDEHKLNEVGYVVRKIVCRAVFPGSEAEDILTYIDEAAESHPELDISEAALLGAIEYIATWVASQITIANA